MQVIQEPKTFAYTRPGAKSIALLLSLAMGPSGCAKLEVPPANAPIEDRVQAYSELRPISLKSTTYVQTGAITIGPQKPDKYVLELANGRRIRRAKQLIPLVYKDSNTAKEAQKAGAMHRKYQYSVGAGAIGVLGGVGLFLAGLDLGDRQENRSMMGAGIGLSLVSFLASGIAAIYFRRRRVEHSYDAYRTYDRDLKRRLELRSNPNAFEVHAVEDPM